MSSIQKQPSRGVPWKRCSENKQQIYRRTPMPKCHFNKVTKQFYWNRTSAWVFSCKFAAQLFSEHFFLRTPLVGCFWYFSRRETRKRWLTESNTFWISTVINKLFNSEVSIICNISDISRPPSLVSAFSKENSLQCWIYLFSSGYISSQ